MKCPECGGTGKSNMYKDGEFVDCMYCGGTGKIEVNMTNEEWFCQSSTEEKATFLAVNKLNFDYQMWLEWLKEIHNEM